MNPFIITSNLCKNGNKDSSSESENEVSSINPLKKAKKKPNDPLYYYYIIEGNKYKYTCKKENVKYTLTFICSDSSCPASDKYNKLKDVFTPTSISHIYYVKHSYIIPDLVEQKFKEDAYIEKDFKII